MNDFHSIFYVYCNIYKLILGTSTTNVVKKSPPKPLSAGGYTEEEKSVLIHTSKVNNHLFVPFMDFDTQDRFHFPISFTDKVQYFHLI